jgi:hypothetical protein
MSANDQRIEAGGCAPPVGASLVHTDAALLMRARDALNGMVGLVQLVSDRRYPDFPVDNHRIIEAQSCINAIEAGPRERSVARGFDPAHEAREIWITITGNGPGLWQPYDLQSVETLERCLRQVIQRAVVPNARHVAGVSGSPARADSAPTSVVGVAHEGECGSNPPDALPAVPAHITARTKEDAESEVQWIVNDNAELGVIVNGAAHFLYKGESLIYEEGTHDDGTPLLYRPVFKREFGECCCPAECYEIGIIPRRYTKGEGWKPVGAFKAALPVESVSRCCKGLAPPSECECEQAKGNAADAARWRALVGCARVKVLGHAGLTLGSKFAPFEHPYAHIGLEIWTMHDAPREDSDYARQVLTTFADKAVEHFEAAPSGGGAEHG